MDFEYLSYLVSRHQYDEIKIIGKTVETDGQFYHFIALLRQGDQAQICVLMQMDEPWDDHVKKIAGRQKKRQFLKENQACRTMSLKAFQIGGVELEMAGGSGSGLDTSYNLEEMMFLAKMMEAGWQAPQEDVFQGGLGCLMLMKYELCSPLQQLPQLENAAMSATWSSYSKVHFVEKRVKFSVPSGEEETGRAKKLAFSFTDEDGKKQDCICYINRVYFMDMWAETEKRFADPENQKRMQEFMTSEEIEAAKQDSLKALEQNCPRGMYFIGVEYECTPDLCLNFYSSDYLKFGQQQSTTTVDADSNGVSVVMMHVSVKPDKELGLHGLRLHGCAIQTPVPSDTKEIWAELFSAHEMVPEQTVDL